MTYYKCGSIHPTQNSNVVIDTASGPIANFETPLAMPLLDAQIDVNAVQDLHGQSGAYPPGGGKNKFNYDGVTWVSGYRDADGNQASSEVSHYCSEFAIEPNTTYTISGAFSTAANYRIYYLDDQKGWISRTDGQGTNAYTFTTPASCHYLQVQCPNDMGSGIQIELGSTATAFAPYSNICPINGWDEISIVGCGKNLFDSNNVIFAYPLASVLETGGVTMRTVFSRCKPNTTYTISKVKSERFIVFWSEKTPTIGINIYGQSSDNAATSLAITTGATAKYICAFVYNANVDTLTPEEILSSIQIEESPSATTFEPYNGSTTVIQLNNTYYGGRFIQDKNGKRKFEVTHEIKTFNEGSWIEGSFGNYSAYSQRINNAKENGASTLANLLCEIYTETTPNYFYSHNDVGVCLNGKTIRIRDDRFSSMNDWLEAVKNYKYIYRLETPYTIDLPDGTPFKSLPGVNNIFADTGDTAVKFRKIG